MKVLIIDDNKADRDIVINYIKNIKKVTIEVQECNCLKDGTKKISEQEYDAIILDLGLPETDGMKTIEAVLEHIKNANKDIPVIVLTGLEDYSLGRQAWSLGVKDFLIKGDVHQKDISRALTFATINKKKITKKKVKYFAK